MKDICGEPKPTHNDMALIPAQGREPQAVAQDVASARIAERLRKAANPSDGPQWVYDNDEASETQEE